MDEKRGSRRQRALKSAKISYGDGAFSVDCTVRNITDTGCMLKVPTSVPIPDSFYLVEPGGKRRRATVVWRRDDLIGVKFAE